MTIDRLPPKFATPDAILGELARRTETGGTVHAQKQLATAVEVDPKAAEQLGITQETSARGLILWAVRDRWVRKGEAVLTRSVADAHGALSKAVEPEQALTALGRLAELAPRLRTMPNMGNLIPDKYLSQLRDQWRDRSTEAGHFAIARLVQVKPKELNLSQVLGYVSNGVLYPFKQPSLETMHDVLSVSAERASRPELRSRLTELASVLGRLQRAGDIDLELGPALTRGAALAKMLSSANFDASEPTRPVPVTGKHLKAIARDLGLIADFIRAFPKDPLPFTHYVPNYAI